MVQEPICAKFSFVAQNFFYEIFVFSGFKEYQPLVNVGEIDDNLK